MKVYIAGPISNNPNFMEDFKRAEELLTQAGYEAINPALNKANTYKEYIDIGLKQLAQCEAIFLLNGYKESAGAMLEICYAGTVGLLFFTEGKI